MEAYTKISDDQVRQWEFIKDVKHWIDSIYKDGLFYSFSLHTLELTRRFSRYYTLCKDEKTPGSNNFKKLYLLSQTLEERLIREGK